ncbi:MAG: F0F1 ATP synthase subunit delta [Dehalococcoidia bacterium]|nr:F0F1 ATP synthase subunit delta [Dehalococcoidia bacterium]
MRGRTDAPQSGAGLNMARGQSIRSYAQAAFESAVANNALDRWEKDLVDVQSLLSNPDFAALVDAPQVPFKVKLDGVQTLLRDVCPQVRNFVAVLIQSRQIDRFDLIRREFRRLADERLGIARAEVVTAVPLDDERRGRIAANLGQIVGRKIVMTEKVDPAVLGGIVARVGDRLIDGSTRTRLHDLRSALASRPS